METKHQELARFSKQWEDRILGVEQKKEKLESTIKDSRKEMIILEIVKREVDSENEDLRKIQKEFFYTMNRI
jgi:hypothetical protein